MSKKEDASNILDSVIQHAREALNRARRDSLADLPRAEPKPLSPEGEQLKKELENLVAAQLALSPEDRSRKHFERLIEARKAQPTLPPTHRHPLLDATMDVVARVRVNRTSGEPKTPRVLGLELIFEGNTEAFEVLAFLHHWDTDFRIGLLEQAEAALAESLSGKDWFGRHGT